MSNTRRPRNPQLGKEPAPRATALIVSLVVLLCIGAVVAIAVLLKGGGDDNTAAGSPGTPTLSQSTTAPSTADQSTGPVDTGLDCSAAPPTPGDTQKYDNPPPKTLAGDATWTATLKTNCGDIVMELNGKAAPQTVSSFVFLAQKHFFDESPCHRLVTAGIYVLQCGDPTGTGSGGPGYGFGIENAPADGRYPTGTVAMARTQDPNSNGSQFFLVYRNSQLPTDGGGYSIFGRVTKGLDILTGLAKGGSDNSNGSGDGHPNQPISILSVTVKKG
ncbi:MAG TPA: peptidylprolyl isomerase [Nocardioidaceae bacterium]|nr:peptidylprolyl isomerase [Nocardioidaceae bacterium]